MAAEQNASNRIAYRQAAGRQRDERLLASGRVVPARITIALDICGLEGPQVDEQVGTWEGNPDGDVDRWELALAVPSAEQVRLLAQLTDFPVAWFYRPMKPGPLPGDGPVWLCGPSGCTALQPNVIDENGVLLYGGEPRTLPDKVQGELFHAEPQEPPAKPPRPPASRTQRAPAKKAAVVEQPTLPSRMPDHLRAELAAKLQARKNRT